MLLKKLLKTFSAVAIALAVSVGATAETKIAVMDQNAVLFTSEAARVETAKLKKEYGEDELQVKKLAEQIKELQTKFETDSAIMDDAQKEAASAKIEETLAERQFLVNKLTKIQSDRRNQFIRQFQPMVVEAVKLVVAKEKIDIVLDSAALIYAEVELNITEKVRDEFNSLYKKN